MSRLVLVGLPGTGKTTVARALATRWRWNAVDTDDLIALAVGTTAADYLRDEGERRFRARELEVLEVTLARDDDVVVATGGGIVCTPEVRALLSSESTLWLDCDDDVIVRRLGDGDRPLLSDAPAEALATLRRQRSAWYRDVSRSRVDSSGSIDDVVDQVARAVGRLTP